MYVYYYEEKIQLLTDKQLKSLFLRYKGEKVTTYRQFLNIIITFAVINEFLKRLYNIRIRRFQYISAMASAFNFINEVKTGGGKTIISLLVIVIKYLQFRQIHVVTPNEYLTQRDYHFYSALFQKLDISSDVFEKDTLKKPQSSVLLGTSSNFIFNYLKQAIDLKKGTNLSYDCLIIDEIDDLLIDGAQTPYSISSKTDRSNITILDKDLKELHRQLLNEGIYDRYAENKEIIISKKFQNRIETFLITNERTSSYLTNNLKSSYWLHFIGQLSKAVSDLQKDKDYVVDKGKLRLISEQTSRLLEGHNYSEGLQEALEVKEGLNTSSRNNFNISITLSNYLKKYNNVVGFSGTIYTEKSRIKDSYQLETLNIIDDLLGRKIQLGPILSNFKDDSRLISLVRYYKHRKQPLLINFSDIKTSQVFSRQLNRQKLEHSLLHAQNIKEEKKIVSNSGKLVSTTLATNVISRGTDILLGNVFKVVCSNNEQYLISKTKENNYLKCLGGLALVVRNLQMSLRIHNQLIGRVARQSLPGEYRVFYSYKGLSEHRRYSSWKHSIFNIVDDVSLNKMTLFNFIIEDIQNVLYWQDYYYSKESQISFIKAHMEDHSFIELISNIYNIFMEDNKAFYNTIKLVELSLIKLLVKSIYYKTFNIRTLREEILFLLSLDININEQVLLREKILKFFYKIYMISIFEYKSRLNSTNLKKVQNLKVNIISKNIIKALFFNYLMFIQNLKNNLIVPELSLTKTSINDQNINTRKQKKVRKDTIFLSLFLITSAFLKIKNK